MCRNMGRADPVSEKSGHSGAEFLENRGFFADIVTSGEVRSGSPHPNPSFGEQEIWLNSIRLMCGPVPAPPR